MIKLNFLWLLCSLPIVTIGASTVAAYTITLKMVDEQEGYIARSFFKAFRENLKQGIPLGILALAATYIVYLDFEIFFALENPPAYILVMTIVSIFVFTLGLIYAFPLSARYENTLIKAGTKRYCFGRFGFIRIKQHKCLREYRKPVSILVCHKNCGVHHFEYHGVSCENFIY